MSNVKKALQGSAMDAGKLNFRVKTDFKFLVDEVILYNKAPVRAAISREVIQWTLHNL
jgi:hypothetical protein